MAHAFTTCPPNRAASLPNYITRVWTTDDGLPDSSVTTIIQSHDGYLWVGTQRSGAVRWCAFHGF
jgi:ligand-binding sensor domain-containing protein